MSKESEAFGLVKRACELYIESTSHLIGTDIIGNTINEALDVIEQTITKAQAQEDENKTLKGLNKYFTEVITEFQKGIRVIREKNVDILDIKLYENYEHYCRAKEDSRLRKDWWLTKEEFDLLKGCC